MGFWKTVIAGSLSTILGSLLLWSSGIYLQAWEWIMGVAKLLFAFLTYQVSVPLGLIFLVAVLFGVLTFYSSAIRNLFKPFKAKKSVGLVFSKNEENIVQLLAEADGRWLKISQIADILHIPNLVVEQAIDSLRKKDAIYESFNVIHGASYRLNDSGRDYAIAKGYVS